MILKSRSLPFFWVVICLSAGLGGMMLLSLGVGAMTKANWGSLSPVLLWQNPRSPEAYAVFLLRLPRTITAALTGAQLALAGLLFQGGMRNPLASPSLFGVTGGAGLMVALGLVFPFLSGGVPVLFLALLGALGGGALVLGISRVLSAGPTGTTLVGVAAGAVFSALTQAIVILEEKSSDKVIFWLVGSVHNSAWKDVTLLLPFFALGLIGAVVAARGLNILSTGEERATALGERPGVIRTLAFASGILLTGSAVAVAGPVSFIGLTAPHLARRGGRRDHRRLLVLSLLWGALLLVSTDLLSRLIQFPYETPSGLLTALIGGGFFLWMARHRREDPGRPLGISSGGRLFVRPSRVVFVLFFSVLLLGLFSLGVGAISLSWEQILAWMTWEADRPVRMILGRFRFPRIVTALLAGGVMGISGTLIQGVVKNPLAAPEILGMTRGAVLGALVVILFLPGGSFWLIIPAALLGGFAGGFLTAGLSGFKGGTRTALTGVAVSSIGASVVTLLLALYPRDLQTTLLWLTGSVWGRNWGHAGMVFFWVCLLVPLALFLSYALDLAALGEERSRSLGSRPERVRFWALGAAIGLASSAVAVVGAVAFIGLMSPHIARRLIGGRHLSLFPVSALIGGGLLIAADTAGRGLWAPVEIPAGLLTALFGGIFFLFLLGQKRRF